MRVRGTTVQRGYGAQHKKLRAWWKPRVDAGEVDCHAVLCLEQRDGRGRRIQPRTPWQLGHTPDRTTWTGPEHWRCGSSEGAKRGARMRRRRPNLRRWEL